MRELGERQQRRQVPGRRILRVRGTRLRRGHAVDTVRRRLHRRRPSQDTPAGGGTKLRRTCGLGTPGQRLHCPTPPRLAGAAQRQQRHGRDTCKCSGRDADVHDVGLDMTPAAAVSTPGGDSRAREPPRAGAEPHARGYQQGGLDARLHAGARRRGVCGGAQIHRYSRRRWVSTTLAGG